MTRMFYFWSARATCLGCICQLGFEAIYSLGLRLLYTVVCLHISEFNTYPLLCYHLLVLCRWETPQTPSYFYRVLILLCPGFQFDNSAEYNEQISSDCYLRNFLNIWTGRGGVSSVHCFHSSVLHLVASLRKNSMDPGLTPD